MKESYVLDENVAYAAATGKNERGQDDPSSLELLRQLLDQCHGLVFSNQLWEQWQSILGNLARSDTPALPTLVIRLLRQFRFTAGIFTFEPEPESFDKEDRISDQDDVYWLRLVVQFQSVGVTTDNRLLNNENDTAILEHHSVGLMRPAQALARLVT